MKKAFDLSANSKLNAFVEVAVDVLNSNMTTTAGVELGFKIDESTISSPQDIAQKIPNGIVLAATEEKTGYEIGLVFDVSNITALADLMLMGDGTPKQELDSDTKDAVTEIANQFFAGLSIPVEARTSKKLQFKMKVVDKFSPSIFMADSYVCVSISGKLKDIPVSALFFMDDDFGTLFEDAGSVSLDTSSFFSSSGGGSEKGTDYSNISSNIDMLLDIDIPVSVRMGTAKLFLKDILGLGPGNIVELDQNADEAIELVVNDKVVARGEVVIVDGYFGFRIKEIISKAERIRKLKD